MSALLFPIVSGWSGALLVFESGEGHSHRIGAGCFAQFKTAQVIWANYFQPTAGDPRQAFEAQFQRPSESGA